MPLVSPERFNVKCFRMRFGRAGFLLLALVLQVIRANIRASASQLRHGSTILEDLIEKGCLLVVGAEYSLETGVNVCA